MKLAMSPASFDVILATAHSLSVELVTEDGTTLLACGAIGGAPLPDGAIAVGLREVGGSDDAGVAYIAPDPSG